MYPFMYPFIVFLVFQTIILAPCWLVYLSEFLYLKKNYPLQGGRPLSFRKYQSIFNTVRFFPKDKLGEFYQQIDEIYPGASQKIEARRKKGRKIILINVLIYGLFLYVFGVYVVLYK